MKKDSIMKAEKEEEKKLSDKFANGFKKFSFIGSDGKNKTD